MKILVIDNGTTILPAILRSLSSHELTVLSYDPTTPIDDQGQDIVVLSGSSLHPARKWHDGRHWFRPEIDYISQTSKPVIGICLGLQLVCMAHDIKPVKLEKRITGTIKVSLTLAGQSFFKAIELEVFERHIWSVSSVEHAEFDVLAYSSTGLEAIRHKTKPIVAVQFHPEMTNLLPQMVRSLF